MITSIPMSRPLPEISREHLSRTLREARERKGWTLEQLSRELWLRGCSASQNKLWRLENRPPGRVDTDILLWLEKVLQVELFETDGQTHVLIEDIIALLDTFHVGTVPREPENDGLRRIHRCVLSLVEKCRAGQA
jgi:transcriptional regulator with XRE-family HTH domain